jgi:hypothetical protein
MKRATRRTAKTNVEPDKREQEFVKFFGTASVRSLGPGKLDLMQLADGFCPL